jgi:hypothetical protein
MLTLLLAIVQQAAPNQNEIDKAIDQGAKWLLTKVSEGLPGDTAINGGQGFNYDALVLYTLQHAGVDREHPTYRSLATRVGNQKIAKTYMAATVAMALRGHDPGKYRSKIYECAQFLVDNQATNGQWDYGQAYDIPKIDVGGGSGTQAKVRIKRSGKLQPPPHGDNSNSQYAALGIHACWMAGVEFEKEVLERAIHWWESSQLGDGSWTYGEKGEGKHKEGGFGSMTAGGGSSVILLRRVKGDTVKSSIARKAIDWLAANFSVTENPGGPEDRKRFHFYYLYALERLGDLYPTEKMGKHLWYAQGAEWLIKNQKGGMWQGPLAGMEIADTCFAILFLERATKVATGGSKR